MFAGSQPLHQVAKRDTIDEIVFADSPGLFSRDKIDRHFLDAPHLVNFRHADSVRARWAARQTAIEPRPKVAATGRGWRADGCRSRCSDGVDLGRMHSWEPFRSP